MNPMSRCLLAIVFSVLAAGCHAIVGAECRSGLEPSAGRCIEPVRASGNDAGPTRLDAAPASDVGQAQSEDAAPTGDADGFGDGTAPDSDLPDGSGDSRDAGNLADTGPPRVNSDASAPFDRFDAGPVCGLGRSACGEACVALAGDPNHCGTCEQSCAGGAVCASGTCSLQCSAPRIVCAGDCVDPRTNDRHCGGCGIDCGDDICLDGVCSAPLVGHVVVVGHDFSEPEPTLSTIFGNACQIRLENPLRVAIHAGTATSTAVNHLSFAMAESLAPLGRSWAESVLDDFSVTQELLQSDVLLLTPQPGRTSAELRALGATWQLAFRQFLERGGVIVALESEGAEGMGFVLQGAGLGNLGPREAVASDTLLWLVAPADSVARDVPLRFRSSRPLLGYRAGNAVVSAAGVSVVIHETHLPRMP